MKLNEIFDTEKVDNLKNDTGEHLGKGAFADVYQSNTDPHMVNKIGKTKDEKEDRFKDREDGFNQYAAAIVDSKIAQSNPAFPRIYKMTNGQFQIEKLTPINEIDEEELSNYFYNNFNAEERDRSHYGLIMDMVMAMRFAIKYDDVEGIKNEYLIQATKWIYNLLEKSKGELKSDVHEGNLMFRRTPVGVQLVITDPVY